MAAGVASGATRAALTQHFALRKNAADVSAKVPGQEIVVLLHVISHSHFLCLLMSANPEP